MTDQQTLDREDRIIRCARAEEADRKVLECQERLKAARGEVRLAKLRLDSALNERVLAFSNFRHGYDPGPLFAARARTASAPVEVETAAVQQSFAGEDEAGRREAELAQPSAGPARVEALAAEVRLPPVRVPASDVGAAPDAAPAQRSLLPEDETNAYAPPAPGSSRRRRGKAVSSPAPAPAPRPGGTDATPCPDCRAPGGGGEWCTACGRGGHERSRRLAIEDARAKVAARERADAIPTCTTCDEVVEVEGYQCSQCIHAGVRLNPEVQPGLPAPAPDHAAWVRDVRDPAGQASEGERVLAAGKARAAYDVAPLPGGGWALTYHLDLPESHRGSPWAAYPSRQACLDAFLAAAREWYGHNRDRTDTMAATAKLCVRMLKLLPPNGGPVEPAPVAGPAARPEEAAVVIACPKCGRPCRPGTTDPDAVICDGCNLAGVTEPPVALVPSRPGCRHLADLDVDGHRAALWMQPDGRHFALFDVARFGNWDRTGLPGEEYEPAADRIAEEATAAAGYLLEVLDWCPFDLGDGTLWCCTLYCADAVHPELWRTTGVARVVPRRWEPPLRRAGAVTLGDLAALLEAKKLCTIKGAPGKPAKGFDEPEGDLLSSLRDSWTTGWAGWKGDMPGWLSEGGG